MKNLFVIGLFAVLSWSSSAFAAISGPFFLDNTAIPYFTDQDWKLLNLAVDDALNKQKNGAKVIWNNAKNNHHGFVQPLTTSHENGMTCRNLKFFNYAHFISGESTHKFCKINNQWKVVN